MIFKFSNPPKNKLIVFDGESINDLKYILNKKKFEIIENRKGRIKEIYIGFVFLANFFFNFLQLYYLKTKNLHTIYLYTLIKMINPKIIITSIDNSLKFSDLAKLLEKKIKFVAIQNSNRFEFRINEYKFKKKLINANFNNKYYIPNYLCFGQNEIDKAKKYNLNIKNFFKVGSIRSANFFRYLEINKFKLNVEKYDICLISEPQPDLNVRFCTQGLEESFILPIKFTIKYLKNNNLKFVFAQKSIYNSTKNLKEINFLKKHLTKEEFEFLLNNSPKKKDFYSSYFHLFQSKVAIGSGSTLLLDKLGCKEKILSVNCSSENLFDFPINGICFLKSDNFNDFSSRVSKILKINIDEYLKELEKPTEYVMAFNKKVSAIEKINSLFLKNN